MIEQVMFAIGIVSTVGMAAGAWIIVRSIRRIAREAQRVRVVEVGCECRRAA